MSQGAGVLVGAPYGVFVGVSVQVLVGELVPVAVLVGGGGGGVRGGVGGGGGEWRWVVGGGVGVRSVQVLMKTDPLSGPSLATNISRRVSWLKSPGTTATGAVSAPTGKLTAGWKVPSP